MGLFAKLLIAALVISALLPFTVLKGKDGRPLMSFSDIKAPDLKVPDVKIPDVMKIEDSATSTDSDSGQDIVYRWVDEEGVTQFSSTPPPEGVEYTSRGYDPNMNLIQSISPKTEPVSEPNEVASAQSKVQKDQSAIGNPYSPEKINKLMDDAKNVQNLLNDRMKQQDALMGK